MKDMTGRSIEVRITEYRDNLLSLGEQLLATSKQMGAAEPNPLTDGARLYELIAGDLTKVIAGEELEGFAVEGVLPR